MDSPTEQADIHRLKYKDKFDGAIKSVDAEAYISNVDHVMDNYSLHAPACHKNVCTHYIGH